MSGYGLRITNAASELVISDDALGLSCIHRATFVSVVQVSGSGTGPYPGRNGGYSLYSSNYAGQILVGLDLPLNKNVGILAVTGGPGAWSIKAYCGSVPDSFGFDTVQEALAVWVYGMATGAPSGFGLALYGPSGSLSQDLSLPNPLYPRRFVTDGGLGITDLPALTRPVAIGAPSDDKTSSETVGFNTQYATGFNGMWQRLDATNMVKRLPKTHQHIVFGPDPIDGGGDTYPASCFVVEGASLP